MWLGVVSRTSIKAIYWIREANKLESWLQPPVRTLKDGNLWSKWWLKGVQCKEKTGKKMHVRRFFANFMPVKGASFATAILFLLIYVLMIGQGVGEQTNGKEQIETLQRQVCHQQETIKYILEELSRQRECSEKAQTGD